MIVPKELGQEIEKVEPVDDLPLLDDDEDFVEVEDCAEDPFVLIDGEFDDGEEEVEDKEAEDEDDDFVLTNIEEELEKAKDADLAAIARTKQLIFFLSLLVATYVLAINTVAGICMLAKSIHALDFKASKVPGGSTSASVIFAEDEHENEHSLPQAIMNRPRLNIPSLSSASTKVLQPARMMMIPRPSRHVEPVVETAADVHVMPSPAVAEAPTCARLGVSPPDIDASTYQALDSNTEPFPSLSRPTPSPRRDYRYPSLAVMTSVESTKAATDLFVVEEVVQSHPKAHPLNFPAVGGNIPYSPSLHIPSVALDRVRHFLSWVQSDDDTNNVVEAKNSTTATIVPVPGTSNHHVSKMKSDLDQFIISSGDHAVVLFYESSSESSHKLLTVWQSLSDKVRHTMKIDCGVDGSLCALYGDRLPFALMIKEGRLHQPMELDYDPLHMFTNFIKTMSSPSSKYVPSNTQAAVTSLSQYSFRGFLSQNKHVVVVFGRFDGLGSDESEHLWSIMHSFSQGLEEEGLNAVVAVVDCHSDPSVCREQHIEKYPTIRWFSNGESSVPDFRKRPLKHKFIKYARRVLAGIESSDNEFN